MSFSKPQTIFCIFSMSCSWAGLPRATGYSPKYMECFLPLDWTSFVLNTTCECSSRSKRDYYSKKNSSETKLFRMARSHSTSTTLWELVFPNSHMAPFAESHTTRVTQTTAPDLTACTPVSMGGSGLKVVSVSSYLKWVVTHKYVIKNLLFVEYPSFGDAGIQNVILHAVGFCS